MHDCYICLECDAVPLGCACRESADVKYAHVGCIVQFALQQAPCVGPKAWSVCSVCRQTFNGEIRRRLADAWIAHAVDPLDLIVAKNNMTHTLIERGAYAEAVRILRALVDECTQTHGAEHHVTLLTAGNLALALSRNDELDAAARIQRELVVVRRRMSGDLHPSTLVATGNLAVTRMRQGDLDESERLERVVLHGRAVTLGSEHSSTLVSAGNLALVLDKRGQRAEAIALWRSTYLTQRRVLGRSHPDTIATGVALQSRS